MPNVALHIAEYDQLGLQGMVDIAFLGNLVHDFYYRDGRDAAVKFLAAISTTLKPGGVLGITDHVGLADQDNAKLHRIEPGIVRALLSEAGFFVEAESDLYANPDDSHTLMVYDERIYRQTNRFFYRARKAVD